MIQIESKRDCPSELRIGALIAARAGNAAAARALPTSLGSSAGRTGSWEWDGDVQPIIADTYFELGDYPKVIEVLKDFTPPSFSSRGLDSRWVRLLRGQALERTGQLAAAAGGYRAVIDQWAGADVELLTVVQQARQRLAAVTGTAEGR